MGGQTWIRVRRRWLRVEPRRRPGSLGAAFDSLEAAGIPGPAIADAVRALEVSPVITAHPTEVRRKTIRTVLADVGRRLEHRSDLADGDPATADIDAELRLDVLTLWQTALLRLSKLRVRDEINDALQYYESTLFATVPALARELERVTVERTGSEARYLNGSHLYYIAQRILSQ